MDLQLKDQLFIVGGASSGFGRAIATSLAKEGARVIAVARNEGKLKELEKQFPGQISSLALDLTKDGANIEVLRAIGTRQLHGALINAGGPPAKTVLDTTLEDWDAAYQTVLRWKIALTQSLIPAMISNGYGRLVYIESASVKQPMENLVLSNSMRLAVVGYIKTLSQEIGPRGITLNVMAPGFHDTAAMDRIINKKIEQTGSDADDIKKGFARQTTVGALGNAEDFASLATWLLSPRSRFINGQTVSVDGGVVKGVMG